MESDTDLTLPASPRPDEPHFDDGDLTLSGLKPTRVERPGPSSAPAGSPPTRTAAQPAVVIDPGAVRRWLDGADSDPVFLGFAEADYEGTPPHWTDVKAAFDARKKSLEAWSRQDGNAERRDVSSRVLNAEPWQTLTRDVASEAVYKKTFVARVCVDLARRKRTKLRKMVTDYVATDKTLQYYEFMSAQGLGRDLGIPKAEVQAIIDEVCAKEGADIETSRELSPFKRLRSAPTTLEGLPAAIVDDFVNARKLFDAGHMAVLLEQWSEEGGAFLNDAQRAEKDFKELKDEEKDSAIWEFVWKLGDKYPFMHLSFGKGEAKVADLAALVKAVDADPARLVPAFRNRQAERWLLHVAGRQDLETWTRKARERVKAAGKAEADIAAHDACLRLLWKTSEEKRLRIGSEAVTSVAGLVALDFRAVRFGSLLPLWKRGLVQPWLEDALHDDEHALGVLDVRKVWGDDTLGAWAALYALGYHKLHLASQDVEQPNDLKRLGPEGWRDLIAPMMDQRLAAWLKEAWKSDVAADLGTVRKKTNDVVAVQELLWRLGDMRLRMEASESTFFDVGTPIDLIKVYKEGRRNDLLAALKDGRLGKWVSEIVPDREFQGPAGAAIRENITDDQKVLNLLWLAGMKDLPMQAGDAVGPTTVADLITWVDGVSVSTEKDRRGALARLHADGTLGLWLQHAQGKPATAIQSIDAKAEHAAEDLLVALGAEQPYLTMTPEVTTFAAVQEGDSRQVELTLHAEGSRGYLYGIIEGQDPRLDLVDPTERVLRIRAGETQTVRFRATIPAGKHLDGQALTIGCRTNSKFEDPTASFIVTTVFPWKVITRYAVFGALLGAVIMILLRGWLEITLIQPLGLPSLVGASQFLGDIGFWRLVLVGLFPGAMILGAVMWIRSRRSAAGAGAAEDSASS